MGQYLLDTHTLLWLHDDSPRLSKQAQSIILDSSNDLQVSMASFWEITIKKALGKLVLAYSLSDLYEACITGNITVIPIPVQLGKTYRCCGLDKFLYSLRISFRTRYFIVHLRGFQGLRCNDFCQSNNASYIR